MKALFKTEAGWSGLVLRLLLGIVMFPHGAQKVLGWFGGYGFSASLNFFTNTLHVPAPLAILVFALEFFGSLALIIGFLTRLVALGLLIEMIVAIAMIHGHYGFFMNWFGKQAGEGFEYHLLVIAICLALLIGGAGNLSVDQVLTESMTEPTPAVAKS